MDRTGVLEKVVSYVQSNQSFKRGFFVSPQNQDGGSGYALQSLEWLSLTFNNMTYVEPGAISWLNHIISLSLAGNELREISGDIWSSLQSVVGFHLDHNLLTVVKNDTFREVHHIDTIYLHMNKIFDIDPAAFSKITFNNYLHLGWNDLSDLRGDMWNGIKSIRWLNLTYNKLSEIRQDMWGEGLVSLQILGLEGNGITQIHSAAFKPIKGVKDLLLRDNLLTRIETDVWKEINVLDLSNNRISFVPNKGLPKLYKKSGLHLENDNLTALSLDIFDPDYYMQTGGHPRELYLNIRRNPLHCDRKLCWIKNGQEEG